MSRRIMIVDDEPATLAAFEFHFRRADFEVRTASSAESALGQLHDFRPDVLVTDVHMGGMTGLELLAKVNQAMPDTDVIVMTGQEDMGTTIGAIRGGAYDFLAKPVDLEQLDLLVARCMRDRAARSRAKAGDAAAAEDTLRYGVGRSPQMIEIYKLIGMLSGTRAPVLIRGETGTGKELVARAIHEYSPWADEPFVAINCTALAESLLESELFGHVKGAFTGAVADRRGKFELAGSGTIFLDEIGDTSPAFQAKLLRVIQEKEFHPVGGERARKTQARVLAATHRPIEELVRQGRFREDLYFRLRVVEIRIPPLRERRDDIPVLAEHLLARAARELKKDVRVIPPRVMQMLQEHDWPGNVREMENAIMRAAVMARGSALSPEGFSLAPSLAPAAEEEEGDGLVTLAQAQQRHVERVLNHTRGNKSRAARILGISRPRLDRLLAAYQSGTVEEIDA
ncbi:sigma-54 dependent transcriptional regulator [Longimicrobium sp.]|uniref:sigma-54-dependent transcriptional regulator n=1 Tax=Longimicrobium sp. TaxID=2029185 RepID=UPI002BC2F068|nr:sigma-54 dependent transcriptional regulator [Longimicrobium sp.]HSU12496.1 sigma-54 dependent transcriptional regulator [Longimicrobium sp.]